MPADRNNFTEQLPRTRRGIIKGMPALALMAIMFLPAACYLLFWHLLPSYIVPFLNHPGGRIACIGLALWHMVGCSLLTRTSGPAWRVTLIVVVFTAPVILCPFIGDIAAYAW